MLEKNKFQDPYITGKGDTRASVKLHSLKTLWFNTGTVCNLSCKNCYIESNPKNDRLVFITATEVKTYLDEIRDLKLETKEIAFTGGEPFLNPHMMDILSLVLERGFKGLVLTNAYMAMNRHKDNLISLNQKYPGKMLLRVSLDHYTKEVHEKERGPNTFEKTLENIKWISDSGINIAIAGRALIEEDSERAVNGYKAALQSLGLEPNYSNPEEFIIFPEMDEQVDVPEITTACWGILNKKPTDVMCATSRMVVKRKGEATPKILACTLLAYDSQFEMGTSFKDAKDTVQLNHPHCAKFCVLGGASCSAN